jgi:penicillin amidase
MRRYGFVKGRQPMGRWKLVFVAVILLIACVLLIPYGLRRLNSYQTDGTLVLPGLKKSVTVTRDEKGMPYIRADSPEDALVAQGFVTAQDRLFQMQLMRMVAQGRISELAGERGRRMDIRMRTIGIHRIAKKHAAKLNEETRRFFQRYVDGVNAFIKTRPEEIPLEFKLAGIRAEPWAVSDSLSVAYFMCWDTSGNIQHEIVAQMLVDKLGLQKAKELFPINVNPDDPAIKPAAAALKEHPPTGRLNLIADKAIQDYLTERPLAIGSNNWALAPRLSRSGKPIVADDPHLDPRILPGIWYPCGLITPDFRAVGVTIPAVPAMAVGRNEYVAVGVTNSYGDSQDLYVETVDPKDTGRYLEGKKSFPFKIVEETLRIKDPDAADGFRKEKLRIRFTRRGPVISGLFPEPGTGKVITLRWAPAETMGPELGLDGLLRARSVGEVRDALRKVNLIMLNFVFADKAGNIGWHTSGRLPIRSPGDGAIPHVVVDSEDNWTGWIPFDKMPHLYNPGRGWVGTCNHYVVTKDYPYYYSSYAAGSYRYRRLKELLSKPHVTSAADNWQFQRDIVNLMAKQIAPVIARALKTDNRTEKMGRILAQWDFRDDKDKAAPLVFQAVYNAFAVLVFRDELGPKLTRIMLGNRNFWYERLQQMVLGGTSPWFDNIATKGHAETRDELFIQAALQVGKTLEKSLGADPEAWSWGELHQIEFLNPIRRSGFGKSLLGGGRYPMGGSCETLYRAMYDFNKPYAVTVAASLRMVADLGDDEKVLAVLPGGVTGRTFEPHQKDQIRVYMNGDKVYWWFSDRSIKEHSKTTQVLKPE